MFFEIDKDRNGYLYVSELVKFTRSKLNDVTPLQLVRFEAVVDINGYIALATFCFQERGLRKRGQSPACGCQ